MRDVAASGAADPTQRVRRPGDVDVAEAVGSGDGPKARRTAAGASSDGLRYQPVFTPL
ncbi:hypothetical protein [Streptomyces panacea]|uniref:hypothetical protein n=1 Tax=Streptomyces panacea TaxID=3035064 RepID=UPI00339C91F1